MNIRAMAACLALGSLAISTAAAAKAMPKAKSAKSRAAPAAVDTRPSAQFSTELANWVISSGDNGNLPFMVIDKVAAEVVVFDAQGQVLGATPALLGITPGDESSPGVGDRELSDIAPEERTTPAGRFVAKFGPASGHRRVLWVDYPTSISLHAVITTNKKERRLQRLKSPSSADNRITFGCINVPARFYTTVVVPHFREGIGVVYILPELKTLSEVFPAYRPQTQLSSRSDVADKEK